MSNWTEAWIDVGRIEDIPPQGSRIVATAFGNIAVFRTGEDRVFAVRDRCPHKGGPLSAGLVHGGKVTCPLHNWVIDLESGEAAAPDEGRTACFAARVEAGAVWLKLG
jgi:nitrite reductase (NADH) small subunit